MLGLRPTTTGVYGLAPWFRTLPRWRGPRDAAAALCGARLPDAGHGEDLPWRPGGGGAHDGPKASPVASRRIAPEFDVTGPPAASA